ncbi:MAG TPA: insulinase family protein, partial [Hyphomicrobiales bacterium]|nr:insulinase family protein [Hyphomicrobiales bacterium]
RFEKLEETFISEIDCNAQLFRHRKTDAQVLSLSGSDENKVFGASFRTPSANSTGIAHIMEHSVLCGSRKYPVKAPFLEMLKSSLNTFLNAMTFSDKTVYPVASTNLQDFYNLVDVYLDAVLHPRITPETLKQEGWHYELDGPDAPLTYKGVVFNEMKGGYSSPDDRVGRLSWRSLFPDTIYGYDAGGDPANIPDLTYETFKRFHERFYHPSNARFFFYGDDDPEKRLEILGAALEEFSATEPDSGLELQPRFDTPRTIEYSVPVNADAASDKQTRVTLNWLMAEAGDPDRGLAFGILDSILLGNSASPLRKALIDSGLGEGVIGGGYSGASLQSVFLTGLKGVAAEDTGKVEALILDTLKRLAEDGIDPLTIESAINTAEFRLRENNTGAFPRGISTLFRALSQWNYDHSPIAPLAWEDRLNALKERLAKGERVFEDLIQTWLLDNPHRTTAVFKPDPGLSEKEASEERARLDKARAAMSPDEVQSVIDEARRLKTLQETPDSPEALAKLPRLTLADLPEKHTIIPMASGTLSGVRMLLHDLPTNGIVYVDIGFDLRQLPADLLPFVSIFRRALLETGAGDLDMVALSQKIGRTTGGIGISNWTSAIVGESDPAAWLIIRSKVMPERLGDLSRLLTKILFSARLDNDERIAQIIGEERARLEAGLIPGGHMFIGQRLAASFHDADWASEQMSGYSYLFALRDMAAQMASGRTQIISKLEQIRERLLHQDAMIINITADESGIDAAKDGL